MQLFAHTKKHAKKIAGIAVLAVALFALIHRTSITANRLPLEVRQLVRNASAREIEWQIATTAQPGDVLEHFVLVRLAADYPEPVKDIRITAQTSNADAYREGSFASRVLGATGGSVFEKGISVAELHPGEFVDLSWQTSVTENTSFAKDEAPLLASVVTIGANDFSKLVSRTVASLFSTLERANVSLSADTFYAPRAYGMNPRSAYEDLGTGVLIAGEDLSGVTKLAISGTDKALVWRLISNELLEAGIPAGLLPGQYSVALYDTDNRVIPNTLSFDILPSSGRAVVVRATPSLVKSGSKRTVVLQGIHLDEDLQLLLSKDGSARTYALENSKQINERVISAEIPGTLTQGTYTILVGDTAQEAHITVN